MTPTYPSVADLRSLVGSATYPLVSIVVPTQRISSSDADRIVVKNAVAEVTARLEEEGLEKATLRAITKNLSGVVETLDYSHMRDGLAIFVSEGSASVFHLSFEPRPAVTVDSTYLLKPIVRQLNREQPYYLLALSERHTRLWAGVRDRLEEIEDGGFPAEHVGVGGATAIPTGYGKRSSQLRDEGHRQFFRQVVASLRERLHQESRPIVVAGIRRYHDFLGEIGGLGGETIGEIIGNVDRVPVKDLGEQSWAAIREHQDRDRERTLIEARDAVASGNATRGLDDTYQSALAGTVSRLVAEESYVVAAGVEGNGHLVVGVSESGTGPGHVDDAVDLVAAEVLRRGGEVRYVDDGALSDLGRVVALLRY